MADRIGAMHILVDHEYEVEDLIKKLENGEKFEQLAADFSKCPSGKQGGRLGEFGKGMMMVMTKKIQKFLKSWVVEDVHLNVVFALATHLMIEMLEKEVSNI